MKRSKKIIKVLLYLPILMLLVKATCFQHPAPESKDIKCPPDDHNTTKARWDIEYDYMWSTTSNFDNLGYVNAIDQLHVGRTEVIRGNSNPVVHEILNTGTGVLPNPGGTMTEISAANRVFVNANYNNILGTDGYLGSIDNYTYTVDNSIIGISGTYENANYDYIRYSLVLTGRIRQLSNDIGVEAFGVLHELGHQLGLGNASHTGGHGSIAGNSVNCCAMYSPWPHQGQNPTCTTSDLYLCDNHLCSINDFAHANRSSDRINKNIVVAQGYTEKSLEDSNIEINMNLQKEKYEKGEIVYLNIKFNNSGSTIDSIILINELELKNYIRIKDISTNQILSLNDDISFTYIREPVLVLNPNESKEYKIDISYLFGNKNISRNVYGQENIFTEGKYEILFDYPYKNLKNITPVLLDVTEVEPSRFQEFTDLINIYNTKVDENYESYKIKQYQNFLNKYPSSIYADEVFRYLSFLRIKVKDNLDKKFQKMIIEHIRKFPESNYIGAYITYVLQIDEFINVNSNEKNKTIDTLKTILKDYAAIEILNLALQNIDLLKNTIKK